MLQRVFGQLTVLLQGETRYCKRADRPNGRGKSQRFWIVGCTCGSPPFEISEKALLSKRIRPGIASSAIRCKSCVASAHNAQRTHGESGVRSKSANSQATPEYRTWKSIHTRCYNEKHKQYHDYGGRGIRVCDRWHTYENFLADMGRRPSSEYSIDRRDNDLDYLPDNCRWATRREQGANKRTTIYVTSNGQTKCITDWLNERGISVSAYTAARQAGKTVIEALGLD